MEKTNEREALEKEIQTTHRTAFNLAKHLVEAEFGFGDEAFEAAMSDESFVERMQERISGVWERYHEAYRKLEQLEEKEGYPAMQAYAAQLDCLIDFLPNRNILHYPFSGVDFYWARIFGISLFEDIAFDGEKHQENWWDTETYSTKNRAKIVALMRKLDIIPKSSFIKILAGDAETGRPDNQCNTLEATLLVKGGHDVLSYLKNRFKDEELRYGAIIAVTPSNLLTDLDEGVEGRGYRRDMMIENSGIIAPFGMELNNIYIYLRT